MTAAGYSGTPLPRKLGLKDGQVAGFAGVPETLRDLSRAAAFKSCETVEDWHALKGDCFDYLHLFSKAAAEINAALPVLRDRIRPDGMIWVSWPKKASKVPTDVTEDTIRNRALEDGLVDIKVCAVDMVWSGLKLVVRKELRSGHKHAGVLA